MSYKSWGISVLLALMSVMLRMSAVCGAPLYVHDPVMIKQGAAYYLFATGRGIPMYRSRDLIQWDIIGPALQPMPAWTRKEVPGFDGRIWAPDISVVEGRYYLYYSVSTFGKNRSCIGLAVNTTLDRADPQYQWIDRGIVVQSRLEDNFNAIDPNLARDETGRYWLAFGSFWSGIQLVEIDSATGAPRSQPPVLIPLASRLGVTYNPIEAPFIFYKQGYYYLFVSFDFCCRATKSTYKIAVGRSPQITGPYVDEQGQAMLQGGGTILLEGAGDDYGPGHNAVVQDGDTDWLIHHAYDGTRGGMSVLRIRPLLWTADGWPRAGEPVQ